MDIIIGMGMLIGAAAIIYLARKAGFTIIPCG